MTLGIMFHHFHQGRFETGQGSINSKEFKKIVDYLLDKHEILEPTSFSRNIYSKNQTQNTICLTFDDGLKSQFDIALPILKKKNLKAFFFLYSNIFTENPSMFEIYRDLRVNTFHNIDYFYDLFFDIYKINFPDSFKNYKKIFNDNYLKKYTFYSENDRRFRFARDQILKTNEFEMIMNEIIKLKNYDIANAKKNIWLTKNDVKKLVIEGHTIGLHSHTHPHFINKLPDKKILKEYSTNYNYLKEIVSDNIWSMSHPNGNYGKSTLDILQKLGIKIGFRSNQFIKKIKNPLEIPRIDHVNILSEVS